MMKDAPAEQDAEFNESQFWLSIKLQGQDWDDILTNACSFLNDDQKEVGFNNKYIILRWAALPLQRRIWYWKGW